MILKGSQRAGARQLSAHLLNDRDNEHVCVHELRGFVANDLRGAFVEAQAVAKGTKCRQHLFSLSLNPPVGARVREADFEKAAEAAERALGLVSHPRAIVFHEKEGRRHAHVVWSRIDAATMRIGGSLIPAHVSGLCAALKSCATDRRLILLGGGGAIANVVRDYRRELTLSDATTFAMALLSMDQHACLLADLGGFPLIHSLDELALKTEAICVLAPATEMGRRGWAGSLDIDRVTSDAIAALIAAQIGASLIIVTDVDGIYDQDPRLAADAALLAEVAAGDLTELTSIDAEAARLIQRFGLEAIVLNGATPGVLGDCLAGIEVRATKVRSRGAGGEAWEGFGDGLVDG